MVLALTGEKSQAYFETLRIVNNRFGIILPTLPNEACQVWLRQHFILNMTILLISGQ